MSELSFTKEQFSNTFKEPKATTMRHTFERLEKYERKFDKDLSDFSIEEIDYMYKNYNYVSSVKAYMMLNKDLVRYSEMCGNPDNNFRFFQNIESMRPYANRRILSEDLLNRKASLLLNPCDVFLLLAPFYGFSSNNDFEEYMINDRSQFLDNNRIRLCTGRILKVSETLYEAALQALDTYEYQFDSGEIIELVGDSVIKLKNYYNHVRHYKSQNARVMIYKRYRTTFTELLGQQYNISNIRLSGIVDKTLKIAHDKNYESYSEIWRDEKIQQEVVQPFQISDYTCFFHYIRPYIAL